MASSGWKKLLEGAPWFAGEGKYPIAAYSEFMPPPRMGPRPYAGGANFRESALGSSNAQRPCTGGDPVPAFDEDDPFGWPVPEAEEELELRPGVVALADHLVRVLRELDQGQPSRGLSRHKLTDNRAWPPELAERKAPRKDERYVLLLPAALSKTQDDKGHARWTLFGSSEQGPARAFWRSFFTAPGRQSSSDEGVRFVRRLLQAAHGERPDSLADLRRAGFRILPQGDDLDYPFRDEGPLPDWTAGYLWQANERISRVRYLLTFRPFAALPDSVRRAYLAGSLHLLPCPGSLLFWGTSGFRRLSRELPLAMQVPLLNLFERREAGGGLRVPQSGLMHEHHPDHPLPDDPHLAIRNTYQRTHRWDRLHRHADPLALLGSEDRLAHVLFSTTGDDLGLYGKPMARNVQLWDHDYHLLLDGPHATPDEMAAAAERVAAGGLFGYRFQFPALGVGRHEVYWHRPVVAWYDRDRQEPASLPDAALGYLTAYRADRPNLDRPIELWPRLLRREPYLEALHLFGSAQDNRPHETSLGARLLLDAWHLAGQAPLSRTFASRLLPGYQSPPIDDWLASLPERARDRESGQRLAKELENCLELPAPAPESAPENLTFAHTARRPFEVAYWKTIARLAEGRYRNKSNADCVQDKPTQEALRHDHRGTRRDLDALGDYLLDHHRRAIKAAGMEGRALAGELPFHWQTDFDFDWMGGWEANQKKKTHERDLIVVIPGRDRTRAVIMADHYDTAYMADRYDPAYGGTKARLASAGADDNHSATAALMLASPIFLEMSRDGRLGCDVWLVHLTGEEFPSDCLGARHLAELLVEGRLRVRTGKERWHDLSAVRVAGVYVMDMIAHNNDNELDVFQISPGVGRQSLWLAEQAHRANEAWNAGVAAWNRRSGRRGRGRAKRSPDGRRVPATAAHLVLRGEVRLPTNPRSTLYNTDGQIFSDAGIPLVLFMENYDINRSGYHDTQDTMANIDLDYGSALTAIVIESVARAATDPKGRQVN